MNFVNTRSAAKNASRPSDHALRRAHRASASVGWAPAVPPQRYLLEVGGVQQARRPRLRQLAEQHVDLLLGADVDAAGRVEAQQRLDAPGDPARDGDLLLVAAGEPAHLSPGPRIDLERG